MTSIRKQWLLIALLPVLTVSHGIAVGQGPDECGKYWRAKAVFIGKVKRTYRGKSEAYKYLNGVKQYSNTPVLHITFEAERTFTGFNSGRSATLVEVECADCLNDGNIRQGESYLVYAYGVGAKGSYPLATGLPALAFQMTYEISYLEQLTAPGTIADALNRVVAGGILSGKAISMPKPAYPAVARAAGASGPVTVAIVLDPSGRVIRAEAVCGHPLLRAASEVAAKMIRYAPTKVKGRAIPVGGLVTYNFVRQ